MEDRRVDYCNLRVDSMQERLFRLCSSGAVVFHGSGWSICGRAGSSKCRALLMYSVNSKLCKTQQEHPIVQEHNLGVGS